MRGFPNVRSPGDEYKEVRPSLVGETEPLPSSLFVEIVDRPQILCRRFWGLHRTLGDGEGLSVS